MAEVHELKIKAIVDVEQNGKSGNGLNKNRQSNAHQGARSDNVALKSELRNLSKQISALTSRLPRAIGNGVSNSSNRGSLALSNGSVKSLEKALNFSPLQRSIDALTRALNNQQSRTQNPNNNVRQLPNSQRPNPIQRQSPIASNVRNGSGMSFPYLGGMRNQMPYLPYGPRNASPNTIPNRNIRGMSLQDRTNWKTARITPKGRFVQGSVGRMVGRMQGLYDMWNNASKVRHVPASTIDNAYARLQTMRGFAKNPTMEGAIRAIQRVGEGPFSHMGRARRRRLPNIMQGRPDEFDALNPVRPGPGVRRNLFRNVPRGQFLQDKVAGELLHVANQERYTRLRFRTSRNAVLGQPNGAPLSVQNWGNNFQNAAGYANGSLGAVPRFNPIQKQMMRAGAMMATSMVAGSAQEYFELKGNKGAAKTMGFIGSTTEGGIAGAMAGGAPGAIIGAAAGALKWGFDELAAQARETAQALEMMKGRISEGYATGRSLQDFFTNKADNKAIKEQNKEYLKREIKSGEDLYERAWESLQEIGIGKNDLANYEKKTSKMIEEHGTDNAYYNGNVLPRIGKADVYKANVSLLQKTDSRVQQLKSALEAIEAEEIRRSEINVARTKEMDAKDAADKKAKIEFQKTSQVSERELIRSRYKAAGFDSEIARLQDFINGTHAPNLDNVNSLASQGYMISEADDKERLLSNLEYLKTIADAVREIKLLEGQKSELVGIFAQ